MTAPDIFISYASEDRAVARRYAEALGAAGLNVWWDDHLRSGEAFDEAIEAALRAAKAVVVLWSPRSVVSRWVRAEATIADRCKTLVPVMIESCERPIMFELTQTADLCHWTGDAGDRAWLAFLSDVRRFVGQEVEATAPTAEAPPSAAPTVQETLKPGQSGSAPSLAVLPFANRSQLPEDEVFAEGMVEDLISALSQGVNVRILGSLATANLSRASVGDPAALGRQLGVRYLLEGNVRRIGDSLRVTAQLLEAASVEVVWTARFDRPLTELAALQEELITEVAASIDAQVYSLEMERALRKPDDLTAWEAANLALAAYRRYDLADRAAAVGQAQRAVAIAPDYAPGHAMLADSLANAYLVGSPDDPDQVGKIRAIAEHARSLAPDDAFVRSFVGHALCFVGYPEEGLLHTEFGVHKAPGSGQLQWHHGMALFFVGRPEESLAYLGAAARLMPGSHLMWAVKGFQTWALIELGRWAEAEAVSTEANRQFPGLGWVTVNRAFVGKQLKRYVESEEAMRTARKIEWTLEQAERLYSRLLMNSPRRDDHLATIRALYAETEMEI